MRAGRLILLIAAASAAKAALGDPAITGARIVAGSMPYMLVIPAALTATAAFPILSPALIGPVSSEPQIR